MNAKTGKDWTEAQILELTAIDAMSKTRGYEALDKFIDNRIDKVDRLSDIRSDVDFKEETVKRRAKNEAYNDIKNFVKQKLSEYNIYQKTKKES